MGDTLFDWVGAWEFPADAPARVSDPVTSHVAARSVHVSARKREVLDAMRLLGSVAVTASQIHEKLREYELSRMDIGSVRSRLSQLREDGLVRVSGVRVVAPPRGSGRPERTWVLVP